MAFKVCTPKVRAQRLPPGYVSLTVRGRMAIHRDDLTGIAVNGAVTLLADSETKRIGLRCPREQTEGRTVEPHVRVWKRSCVNTAEINIVSALIEIGVDIAGAKGRYELHRHPKDRMLYICLLKDETP